MEGLQAKARGGAILKAAQTLVSKKKLPNFIPKDEWAENLPDLSLVENIWRIVDEKTYKQVAPKTLDKLRRDYDSPGKMGIARKFYNQPIRENVRKNKGGYLWLLIFQLFNVNE